MEVYERIRRDLALAIVAATIFVALLNMSPYGRDDSDGPDGRSGLRIHTDHKTGCQYFSSPGGGLTPRLGVNNPERCKP